ncbi:MAG: DUF1573 domain-containing protein [Candidatus Cloacimonetes bacterium]|nr:DUF1573 domain-containing protein [Candidatus Cloacimonadota bacterium]
MKKYLSLIILVLFSLSLFAEPIIQFEELSYKFEDLKEEEGPHEHNFKFTNIGDVPLIISKVKAG